MLNGVKHLYFLPRVIAGYEAMTHFYLLPKRYDHIITYRMAGAG